MNLRQKRIMKEWERKELELVVYRPLAKLKAELVEIAFPLLPLVDLGDCRDCDAPCCK